MVSNGTIELLVIISKQIDSVLKIYKWQLIFQASLE